MTVQLIVPVSLGSGVAARLEAVKSFSTNNLTNATDALVMDMQTPVSPTEALKVLHRLQRLYAIGFNGLQDNAALLETIEDTEKFPLWDQYAAIEASDEQKQTLATLMYDGDVFKRAPIMLQLFDYARDIGEMVLQRCVDEKVDVDPYINDPVFNRRLFAHITVEQATMWGEETAKRRDHVQRSVVISSDEHHFTYPDEANPSDVPRAFQIASRDYSLKNTRNLFFTLTTLPTPKVAGLEDMTTAEYVDLFFRMCAVDWDKVNDAHLYLIDRLNAGNILRFTNSDGTDVTMSIEGMTFCNSRVAKNVPGSEVFSAPVRDSINGIIVAEGRYDPTDTLQLIENITMRFENGKLVEASAEKNDDLFQKIIDSDEGARYVGEIGIGTNPVLQRPLINTGLVEKIGGSFHVALGTAYEFTDYMGVPVNVDNGNRSGLHWDITTMLVGKEGMMYLDGKILMKNGKFVDQELAYLNATS